MHKPSSNFRSRRGSHCDDAILSVLADRNSGFWDNSGSPFSTITFRLQRLLRNVRYGSSPSGTRIHLCPRAGLVIHASFTALNRLLCPTTWCFTSTRPSVKAASTDQSRKHNARRAATQEKTRTKWPAPHQSPRKLHRTAICGSTVQKGFCTRIIISRATSPTRASSGKAFSVDSTVLWSAVP